MGSEPESEGAACHQCTHLIINACDDRPRHVLVLRNLLASCGPAVGMTVWTEAKLDLRHGQDEVKHCIKGESCAYHVEDLDQ